MADPFQPRFVDLVRNFTSSQGTGDFTLGPAVNGFTSFTDALQPGDGFYYSAIGVDKPNEREVGRGTLSANGKISRSPIGGAPTNFSSGTKSVALIAAAEWFTKLEAAGAAGSGALATRAAMAAAPTSQPAAWLTEPRREGLFVFDASNLSALVAADTRQGLCVAPASDPTGASGAWVRKYDGPLNALWFGAVADNATDNYAAISAALAVAAALKQNFAYGAGTPRVHVPAATNKYYVSQTLSLTTTTILEGDSVGEAGGGATVLRFPAGQTGIRVQRADTSGATGGSVATGLNGGDASIIRNLTLEGGYAGTEGEFHGIQLRARASIRDVMITNFQGDGIHIEASSGAPDIHGNANNWEVSKALLSGNRNGLYVNGADVNAGAGYAIDAMDNRQWGVWDSGFLGDTYTACHVSGNGIISGSTSVCSYNGNRYYVVHGQEAGASTNAPSGTTADNTYWRFYAPGGPTTGALAWVSGMTWRAGGAYCTDDPSGYHVFSGCYSESGQPPSQYVSPTMVVGGAQAAGASGQLQAIGTSAQTNLGVPSGGGVSDAAVNIANTNQFSSLALKGNGTTYAEFGSQNGIRAYVLGAPKIQLYAGASYGAAAVIAEISSAGMDMQAGKAVSVNGTTVIDGSGNIASSRVTGLAAIATSGSALDLVSGSIPAARIANGTLTYAMHANTAASKLIGNPTGGAAAMSEIGLAGGLAFSGSNLTLGAITPNSVAATGAIASSAATGGVGYATGAGGAVAQATSKSTGVTLNKASGQITTHNASLAAAAVVAFTVTNSAVAATDTINLNLASGNATAGTYRYWVEGLAAGSFKIVVENRSGGALAEALTFNFAVLKAVAA